MPEEAPAYMPFGVSAERWLSMTDQENYLHSRRHWDRNAAYIEHQLERLNADFVVIGSETGKVYMHGRFEDYPSVEELERLMEEKGELPMSYSNPSVPEELAA